MVGSKTIRLYSEDTFFPLIYLSGRGKYDQREIDDYDGIIAEIMIAIRRNLNLTFQQVYSNQDNWDLKTFPHVISYNRLQDYRSATEIYYSKVTMFSQLSQTQHGSFLSNIFTIPLWFLGLVFLAIFILSALTKEFEKSNKFGSFMWMYFAPLFQKSFNTRIVHRMSAHLLNIWNATLIVLNIVVLSYITADVLVGQKIIMNHLNDILQVENLKFTTSTSNAMVDFFRGIPGEVGKRIRSRYYEHQEGDIDRFKKVVNGELVYIDWHEEVASLNVFCELELDGKIDGRPLLYQSPFPLKIDSVGFLMQRNHSIDKDTLHGINRMLRFAAAACLCDEAIKKAYWQMNTMCITTENRVDDRDYTKNETELRLLLSIFVISLMPACLLITLELCFKLCPCFNRKSAAERNCNY